MKSQRKQLILSIWEMTDHAKVMLVTTYSEFMVYRQDFYEVNEEKQRETALNQLNTQGNCFDQNWEVAGDTTLTQGCSECPAKLFSLTLR